MPHASLKLIPGVDQSKTLALNESAISESQLIRFVPDRTLGGIVQKLGGWTKFFSSTVGSIVRCLWAWEDTNANSYLAIGAEGTPSGASRGTLQVIQSGGLTDITPQTAQYNVPVSFSTTAGSNIVTVTHSGSNISDYDVVDIRTHISVGGIILFGQYQCYALGANTYNIRAYNVLLEPYLATSTVTNGGAVSLFTLQSGSDFVNVTLANHGYVAGQSFPILIANSVAGVTLYGNYVIQTVLDANNFVISATTQASTIRVTGASGTGTNATLTQANSVTFTVGSTITVANVNPSGYNGTKIVNASTNSTVSYLSNVTATYVANGTISGFFSIYDNSNQVNFLYQKGIGPLPGGSGYGVGPYGAGGYGTGIPPIAGTGTPINADDWTLDNWGEILVANPINGPIYAWNPTTGDPVAQVIPEAPVLNHGIFVAMPQRQIIAWGTTFTGIHDPLLIRWCDVNNYNT